MFCTECGTPSQPGAKFCGKCGRPVAAAPAPGVAAPTYAQPVVVVTPGTPSPAGGTRGCLLGGAVVVGLVVVAVAALLGWSALTVAKWEDAVQQHLEAIAREDYARAYALTSRGFHGQVPEPAFRLMAAVISSTMRKSKFVAVDKRATSETTAVVKGNLVDSQGASSPVTFTVVKEGDGWLIHEIDLEGK